MTKLINLFGGPGTGKSTIASGLTYELKKRNITCDTPYEFAKQMAWDNSFEAIKDQLYILGNQHRGVTRSYNKVDYIILDSPILLSLLYKSHYNEGYPAKVYKDAFNQMVLDLHHSYDNVNIFLKRKDRMYNEKERFQSLQESIVIDDLCLKMLNDLNVDYHTLDTDDDVIKNILKIINF